MLFEGYPAGYVGYAKRLHRWVRGDWQLWPWLLPRVPTQGGRPSRNSLAPIDRWKVLDNLRRSLIAPATLVLLVLGWTWLPGSPLAWTLGALGLAIAPSLPAIARDRRRRRAHLARAGLAIVFLAHEAAVIVDAIARVSVRTAITRKRLLQWTSAAHTATALANQAPRALAWRAVAPSPILAVAISALVAVTQPIALIVAAPLLLAWLAAPEIARAISQPRAPAALPLRPDERAYLRQLARRTWRFFDAFVGPIDQWLVIDNYQAEPNEQLAHRTSPTNIGLMLLATLSAYDFGYVGPGELALRLRRAFDSITRLPHYRGHLLNWYDTKSLEPLLPRYVSTVDSGNFAGCLIALAQGCREIAAAPVVRLAPWRGLADSAALLGEVVATIPAPSAAALRGVIARLTASVQRGADQPDDAYAILCALCDDDALALDREVLAFVETGAVRHDGELLRALRETIERLHQQLRQMRRELESLLPWLALGDEPAATALALPRQVSLDALPATSARLRAELAAWLAAQGTLAPSVAASAARLDDAFARGAASAETLRAELLALAARADDEVRDMDFRLLYDRERALFRIGYNVTADQADSNHYDLLASEARLASYLAIVRREVPETHWYALGRPMTSVAGEPTLVSWGGTMFEYLMPNLLMRSQPGTLLARTSERAVAAQMAWGTALGTPWGVSESAFARADAGHTYQYRSFGVPGLGFRRELEDDRVVTPYASALAVAIRPRDVVANLRDLEARGMAGTYGLFEALDLTPARAGVDQAPTVVRSYMAHHQGMLMIAIGNLLNERSMVDRFHADAAVATGELLLNELAPDTAPPEWPLADPAVDELRDDAALPAAPGPWASADPTRRQAFVLGNGRMTSLVTDAGGGGLTWRGLALTRGQPDPTCDDDGLWLYVRDEVTHRIWRATGPDGRTTFAMHSIELHRRHEGISVHVEVTVAPADDVELRQLTLHNETDAPRRLTVTSAGRPVLLAERDAAVHPAFASLFVESEHLAELDAVAFARRPRAPSEAAGVVVHRLVREGAAVSFAGYETDRIAFQGRGGRPHLPAALAEATGPLRGRVGAVLDPVMSVMAQVELKAKGTVTLAFVTTVARTRPAAIELAHRYGTMHAVRWAFRDAALESPRRLARAKLDPALVPAIQRLFAAMWFADPNLRVVPDGLPPAAPCKQRLWGRGISGDDPIVLVRVHDPDAPLLRELLAAQRYLRWCGVRLDLVLIDAQTTGYDSDGSGTLRRVIAQHDDHEWIGRNGGLHVFAADQATEDERRHLEATARIVLDTRDGGLEAGLARVIPVAPRLPRFDTSPQADPASPPRPRPPLVLDNGSGGFSPDGREYVIALPAGGTTPAPWCNVIANETFGCLVSEASLGTTWSLNSGENKLTPWRNDPAIDLPSEVLYLRDEETAVVWSPTPRPAGHGAATTVRHGAGYTQYERADHGFAQTMTVFVPPDAPLKIVRLRLTNQLARHRRVTATYYAEWVLGPRPAAQRAFIASEHDRDSGSVLATTAWNAEFGGRVAFLAAGDKTHGFTTDRGEFLGARGDYARPEALERWGLSGSTAPGVDPCAALQIHLELAPGETRETHFVLGQAASRDEALALIAEYQHGAAIAAAWTRVGAFWDELLGDIRVATPEPAMDLLVNRWLLYQAVAARLFGRIGFYQAGGAFGYRDQLQDVLALLHAAPARARAQLLLAAAHQFEDGDVLHWWHPPAGRGVRTRCSDDLLWLPFVTAEYVAATGDLTILDAAVPFLAATPLRPDEHDRYDQFATGATAPLLEHCRRALERGATSGAHGLPLMGDGDWNDGMNLIGARGRGESVWLAWFLAATMDRFAAVCARIAAPAESTAWRARADALRIAIAGAAWDGGWYVRAFHDDGSTVGAAASRECRIDSIAQSWAVLSRRADAAPDERAGVAVRAADAHLVRDDERLVRLFWPPFDTTSHDPGYVRAYPPGVRENGGQYTHGAVWLAWAHAALGDGDGAARLFRLLNPVLRAQTAADVERYRVEPYVLAADIYGAAPWTGRGGWTWYTGSAAWMWRLGVEAILGIRREDGGVRLAPCIPTAWPGFEAWFHIGRQEVHVVVVNPARVSTGIAQMTLDGAILEGRIVLDPAIAGHHEVHLELGPARGAHAVVMHKPAAAGVA
ncbi:MAG: cellobiose phosphorylase [Deltaproteobacteria bacterium]|nr:cellobiose phosphorylase [Deltaproteobacteria bacterium]